MVRIPSVNLFSKKEGKNAFQKYGDRNIRFIEFGRVWIISKYFKIEPGNIGLNAPILGGSQQNGFFDIGFRFDGINGTRVHQIDSIQIFYHWVVYTGNHNGIVIPFEEILFPGWINDHRNTGTLKVKYHIRIDTRTP